MNGAHEAAVAAERTRSTEEAQRARAAEEAERARITEEAQRRVREAEERARHDRTMWFQLGLSTASKTNDANANAIEVLQEIAGSAKPRLPPAAAGLKNQICSRLVKDWSRLADWLNIPLSNRAGFEQGREPEEVWEWLDQRHRLGELFSALQGIGRSDLSKELGEAGLG